MFTNPEAGDVSLEGNQVGRREAMPQIIVTATNGDDDRAVMLRERITSSDFESETFAARLVERLGWAVDDAHAAEQAGPTEPAVETPETPPDPPEEAPVAEPAAKAQEKTPARV